MRTLTLFTIDNNWNCVTVFRYGAFSFSLVWFGLIWFGFIRFGFGFNLLQSIEKGNVRRIIMASGHVGRVLSSLYEFYFSGLLIGLEWVFVVGLSECECECGCECECEVRYTLICKFDVIHFRRYT